MKTVNKLLTSFDKMGFASDPYLGYLTVSPQNLGTGIHMEGTVTYRHKFDKDLPQEVVDEIDYGKQLVLDNNIDDTNMRSATIKTNQNLAPNYNENQQISDFLESLKILGCLDIPPPGTALKDIDGAPG
jgi:hypothetical protein